MRNRPRTQTVATFFVCWSAFLSLNSGEGRRPVHASEGDSQASAQEPEAASDAAGGGSTAEAETSAEAQANNPLANMRAFNLQNYYIPELTEIDEEANTFWFRYAQPISTPIGDWLMRASLPLSKVPSGADETDSGIGDSNVFAAYLFDSGKPGLSLGAGPLLGIPTGSKDALGTDQWSMGAAAVIFDASDKVIQWGSLVTYQHKIAGSGRVADVNVLATQPFGIVQLGEGLYIRSAPIWVFNLENGDHHVPVGLGLGKVVKLGRTVLNFFVEPQVTILDDGPGQPEFQIYMGLNLQFYPKKGG